MRCPDCSKFVGSDLSDEVEVNDEDINGGTLTASARIVRACSECGTELKEATFDMELDVQGVIDSHEEESEKERHDYEVEVESSSATEAVDWGKNKKTGKPNKPGNPRYAKTLFGAEVVLKLKCSTCSADLGEHTLSDNTQASAMDEMV